MRAPPGSFCDEAARHAFSTALALLHRDQDPASGRRRGAGAQALRDVVRTMGQTLPKPGLQPFLPVDVPMLAAIFVASIEELTGEDYNKQQQQAWMETAENEEFGRQ